jgi:hypothetical protein
MKLVGRLRAGLNGGVVHAEWRNAYDITQRFLAATFE